MKSSNQNSTDTDGGELWDDPSITAYVLGELGDDEASAFETRLSGNPELAAAVEQARGVTGQLESLFAGEPSESLESERRAAILTVPSESKTQPVVAGSDPASARLPLIAMAVAAALLMMVGLPWWLHREFNQVNVAARNSAVNDPSQALDRNVEPFATPNLTDMEFSVSPLPAAARQQESLARSPQQRSLADPTPAASESESKVRSLESPMQIADRSALPEVAEAPATAELAAAELAAPEAPEAYEQFSKENAPAPQAFSRGIMPAEAHRSKPSGRTSGVDSLDLDGLADVATPLAAVEVQLKQQLSIRGAMKSEAIRELKPVPSESPYSIPDPNGLGPGRSGDRFDPIVENEFKKTLEHHLSTFSVDVDTASYSKVRDTLMRAGTLPSPDMVRIEELVNYFRYGYNAPPDDSEHPFSVDVAVTDCPWKPEHRLARIAIQGKRMAPSKRPPCNLVFLLDTSGSMDAPNKLPLVIEGMKMLTDQLNKEDRISIVVYAGSAGLVLDATSAKKTKKIKKALTELSAGGSTNGAQGIQLAFQVAREHFITDGVNRVMLCTDGDFNVGMTSTDALVRMLEKEAKAGIYLTVLGFGMGNHNDAMLEQISGKGNGNYAFIDTLQEAKKVLVDQTSGTLVTIAKDVKIQIDFNASQIAEYRLIGYENRVMAKEDFKDKTKDAGEIGAGHQVTALYELVPQGVQNETSKPPVNPSKYQTEPQPTEAAESGELFTVHLAYKRPDQTTQDESTYLELPVSDDDTEFGDTDEDTRFAAAVAGFGMKLRRSKFAGKWTMTDVLQVAKKSLGDDEFGFRAEFIDLVNKANALRVRE